MDKDQTQTYSLLSLLDGKVDLDAHTQVPLSALVVPRIQRPYAQGRTDEHSTYVRQNFLDELFAALVENKECDLNFIYGIVTERGEDYQLELLDGQQRLTTLFLLYWYLACAELQGGVDGEAEEESEREEDGRVRRLLRKFMYQTRPTASLFCRRLADFRYDCSCGDTPSECIRTVKWYFKSFDRDSTVSAMLNTLDDIHTRYVETGRHDLFKGLENIRFYVKSLGLFNLSEELYIKMNARGLQLTPFENFKADLTNFISHSDYKGFRKSVALFKKGVTEQVGFDFNFSVKMDAKWVDLFWQPGSEDFDDSMMSFFSRFFSCRYIIDSAAEVTEKEMRSDKTIAALYTNAEATIGTEKYLGFKVFDQILSANPENVVILDRVLDTLFEFDLKDGVIYRHMLPRWDKEKGEEGDDFYRNSSRRNTQMKMVALGATISYIWHLPQFDPDGYGKWMRVVWNIIENTNIDSLQPVTSLMRKFEAMAAWIGKRRTDEGMDFYQALSTYRKADTGEKENRAVLEEVEKARRVAEDPQWEHLFMEAELHPFFKGTVAFFYSPEMTPEEFRLSSHNAALMFDARGISPSFRTDHLLIRAIMSRLNTWDQLDEQYITERAETQKYLKNLLVSNEEVQKVIRASTGAPDEEGIKASLRSSISEAPEPQAWPGASEDQRWGLFRAVKMLRDNVRIYDWMAENEEKKKKSFRAYWYNGHIMLAQPRQQFAKIAMDTERAKMADKLAGELGMEFYDENQQGMWKSHGEMFGNDIWLYKEYGQYVLWIGFRGDHEIVVEVKAPSKKKARELADQYDDGEIDVEEDPTLVKFKGPKHWRFERDYERLKEFLEKKDFFFMKNTQAQNMNNA